MPTQAPDSRSQLLSRLHADLDERWRRGEPVRVERYLAEHPTLAGDAEALLDLVCSEVRLRLHGGEQPALAEYLERFPQHADALRRGWPSTASAVAGPHSTSPEARTVPVGGAAGPAPPALPGLDMQERLGVGGMGVVWRAREVRLGRVEAVKVIRGGPLAGEEAHERFQREAQAVARLDHPGVVRVYDFGEHGGALYLRMELVEGGSLQQRLRGGPLPPREAAELVRQLALAVQHAHERGVLHRDLKPGNVLLAADGAPKITDFGLAKILDSDDGVTRTGAVMGTPSYMAPEQAAGRSADVGAPTDVWALGAILYECLTGQPPFRASGRTETLALVQSRPPEAPRRLRPDVPPELEAICLKCLEKAPAARYASAAALAEDLLAWLEGKPTRARPARGVRRLLRGLRRHPRLACLAALLVCAAAAVPVLRYFTHPDRPLWQMQERLRRGESVEPLGATGPPRWSRWRLGEKDAKAFAEPDGTFVVQGWPLALLELLPDTCGQGSYRLTAEVRHVKGGEHGSVGVYLAQATHQTPTGPVLSFLRVGFDDVHDLMDEYNRYSPELRKFFPPPKGNRVAVAASFVPLDPDRPTHTVGLFAPELFKPAGHSGAPGDWRALEILVSPEGVRVSWSGKFVGARTLADIEKEIGKHLDGERRSARPDPALAGLPGRLDLRGGLGLYVHLSYASFRNVRVEPRDGAGGG
jgi:serine/threonine-protein kinase